MFLLSTFCPFAQGDEVKSLIQGEQTARQALLGHFVHRPEQFQLIQTPDELLVTYQPFFSRCTYRLQPEQLLIEDHHLFGVRSGMSFDQRTILRQPA